MPYASSITKHQILTLNLLDEIPFKYLKEFTESFSDDDSVDCKIEDTFKNSDITNTKFTFKIEYFDKEGESKSKKFKINLEWTKNSDEGEIMINELFEESEDEDEE